MIDSDVPNPVISVKGDWIDLRAAETIELEGPYVAQARRDRDRTAVFTDAKVSLGIAMQLPKGYEAVTVPRSSAYKYFGVILCNSVGIIDGSYNGDNDEWFAHIIPFKKCTINKGDRICQFRIQLSQKATMWQKRKWLCSNGVKLEFVKSLGNPDRGGHGSTGRK